MFRNLADYSISFFSPLRVFNSITFCGVLALVGAFVVAVWLMPRVIAFLTRTHATENLSKESVLIERQHASKAGTPTMGGLVIVASLLAAALLFCDLRSPLVWIGLLVFAGNGFIGFIDDLVKLKGWEKHGLNKRQKTAGLLLVAILAAYLFVDIFHADDKMHLIASPAHGKSRILRLSVNDQAIICMILLAILQCSNDMVLAKDADDSLPVLRMHNLRRIGTKLREEITSFLLYDKIAEDVIGPKLHIF